MNQQEIVSRNELKEFVELCAQVFLASDMQRYMVQIIVGHEWPQHQFDFHSLMTFIVSRAVQPNHFISMGDFLFKEFKNVYFMGFMSHVSGKETDNIDATTKFNFPHVITFLYRMEDYVYQLLQRQQTSDTVFRASADIVYRCEVCGSVFNRDEVDTLIYSCGFHKTGKCPRCLTSGALKQPNQQMLSANDTDFQVQQILLKIKSDADAMIRDYNSHTNGQIDKLVHRELRIWKGEFRDKLKSLQVKRKDDDQGQKAGQEVSMDCVFDNCTTLEQREQRKRLRLQMQEHGIDIRSLYRGRRGRVFKAPRQYVVGLADNQHPDWFTAVQKRADRLSGAI